MMFRSCTFLSNVSLLYAASAFADGQGAQSTADTPVHGFSECGAELECERRVRINVSITLVHSDGYLEGALGDQPAALVAAT